MSPVVRTHSSVSLPLPLLQEIDKVIEAGLMGFRSRAEFIAEATRAYLRDARKIGLDEEKKPSRKKHES